MADRYLRATGNWNGPVWAATSGGAAGSAATPTSGDDVYIDKNYTVTLTTDAECGNLSHTNGTLYLSSYKLTVIAPSGSGVGGTFASTGSTSRTINLGSGTLDVGLNKGGDYFQPGDFILSGSNLTFNAGTSLVVYHCESEAPYRKGTFSTLSKTFNDVSVLMGDDFPHGGELDITGDPTFRLLDIRSANDKAHTVNFDSPDSYIIVQKFIGIGSSSSARLTIDGGGYCNMFANDENTKSVYGQFLHITNGFYPSDFSMGADYMGSNSTDDTDTWLLQDPPKISTLVDPLTTAPGSNPNWTTYVSSGDGGSIAQITTGHSGGGYKLTGGTA